MLASVLNTEGRSDEAIAAARGALAIDANFGPAEAEIGNALLAKGDLKGAEAAYLRATSVGSIWARSGLAIVAARSGDTTAARALLKKMESERRTGYVAGDMIAMAYAGMGDRDAAFRWLDTAMIERSGVMPEVRRQAMYKSLHSDPRWANMLARMGWR
jgi:tetratricopeptide (TPR) repeat protein